MSSSVVELKHTESKEAKKKKPLSQLSHSDSELDMIDWDASSLSNHSHFFAPSGHPHNRYSTPLILISPGHQGSTDSRGAGDMPSSVATQSSESSNGAPSLGSLPYSASSRSKLIVPSAAMNGHFISDEEDRRASDVSGWPGGRLYINKDSLAHDLSFLANMPELCDVTFLVGEERQPICAVRAILAARSRLFRRMLYGENNKSSAAAAASSKKQKKKQHNFKPSDGYIEKYDFRGQPTVVVNEFEPDVFKQLIEYTHTGSVMLQARTLLGLMNAADHYGIEDLKQACIRFMEHCVTIDTVCSLLSSAEKYIQYKSTKILVQKMFEFVDQNAETILSLGAFSTLPQHVVRIVLGRDDLHASETTKFEAALRWCYRYCDEHPEISLKQAFEPFADVIDYYMIPAKLLMQSVKPVQVVDDSVILTALAYQADPKSIEHLRPTSMSFSNIKTRSSTSPCGPDSGPKREFRRVQSSGLPLNTMINPMSLKVSHGGRVRAVTPTPDSRSIRGSSMPVYVNDAMKRVKSQDAIDFLDDKDTSHHQPVKGHHYHHMMTNVGYGRDRLGSHNSHISLLSSPPLSPVSPSTGSYQESTISTFSGSSLERESYHILSGRSLSPDDSGDTTPQASINEQRKMAYNPQALDTVVTLSSTNAVEV